MKDNQRAIKLPSNLLEKAPKERLDDLRGEFNGAVDNGFAFRSTSEMMTQFSRAMLCSAYLARITGMLVGTDDNVVVENLGKEMQGKLNETLGSSPNAGMFPLFREILCAENQEFQMGGGVPAWPSNMAPIYVVEFWEGDIHMITLEARINDITRGRMARTVKMLSGYIRSWERAKIDPNHYDHERVKNGDPIQAQSWFYNDGGEEFAFV